MIHTPTHQLQEALDRGTWQGGQDMTERERLLVEQLVACRAQLDSVTAQLDSVEGQYRHE